MKTCSKCQQAKPLTAFYKARVGVRADCKVCVLERDLKYRQKNAEAIRAYDTKRRGGNKEKRVAWRKAREAAWTPKQWAEFRKYHAEYREARRDKLRSNARAFYAKHADRYRALSKQNRERERLRAREYYRLHPEKSAARFMKYSRGKSAAAGCASAEQIKARFELYGNRCAYCGADKNITADHVIPLSRGGSNYAANIRPACRHCNSSKKDKKLSEWKQHVVSLAA